MARRKNAFLTPDVIEGGGETCRLFRLPLELVPYLTGALSLLTEPYRWEEYGTMTPAEASERFAAILSSVEDACPIMDVRQSLLDPCILEKTYDGVTWETFGVLDLCAPLPIGEMYRIDPEDPEQPQFSYDGETWTDIPGDPLDDPITPALTETPGADDDARFCLASRRAAISLAEFYSQTYGAFTAGLFNALGTMNEVLQTINNYLFSLIYPQASSVYRAAGFGEQDFEETYTAATLTDEQIDFLQCLLYDNASVADGIVTFDFTGVQTGMIDAVGINPGVALQSLLTYLQSEGLNRAGNVEVTDDDDCDCGVVPTDCLDFNFQTACSTMHWTETYSGSAFWFSYLGCGWARTNVAPNSQLAITLNMGGPFTITEVNLYGDNAMGSTRQLIDVTGPTIGTFTNMGGGHWQWTGSATINGFYVNLGNGGAHLDYWIRRITVKFDGAKPFGDVPEVDC